MKLYTAIDKLCELAEEILELTIRRGRNSHLVEATTYKARLMTPLEVTLLDSQIKNDDVLDVEEESTIQLSQSGSFKNLQDCSQVSTRSQTRRLRGRENSITTTPIPSTTLKSEFCPVDLAQQIQSVLCFAKSKVETLNFITQTIDLQDKLSHPQTTSVLSNNETTVDPGVGQLPAFLPLKCTLAQLLSAIVEDMMNLYSNHNWSSNLVDSMKRLAGVISSQVEFFTEHLSVKSLLWLAEVQHEPEDSDILKYLLPRLSLRILRPDTDAVTMVRFLWLNFLIKKEPLLLSQLETTFNLMLETNAKVRIIGAMNPKGCPIISKMVVAESRTLIEQANFLKGAQQELADPATAKVWLVKNEKELKSWLYTGHVSDEFINFAYLISKTSKDTQLVHQALILAIVKSVNSGGKMLDELLKVTVDYPDVLIGISSNASLLEQIVTYSHGTGLAFCVLAVLFQMESAHFDLVLILWRDIVAPEEGHIREPQFLDTIERYIQRYADDISSSQSGRYLLDYAVKSIRTGTPLLPLRDNGLNFLSALNRKEDGHLQRHPNQNPNAKDVFSIVELAYKIDSDWKVDGDARVLEFIEHIVPIMLSTISRDWRYLERQGAILRFLSAPIGSPVKFKFCEKEEFCLSKDFDTLVKLLQIREEISPRLTLKKRTFEALQALRVEKVTKIILKPDWEELWILGTLYEAELYLWLVKDATTLLKNSSRINLLVLGAFNCWDSFLRECQFPEWERLSKFTHLIESMACGVLSLFLPDNIIRHLGKCLKSLIQEKEYLNQQDWWMIRAKALVVKLLKGSPALFTLLCIESLSEYLKNDSNCSIDNEIVYQSCNQIIGGILKIKDENPSLASSILTKFTDCTETCKIFIIKEDPVDMSEVITSYLEQLGKFDKRRTYHSHLYTLARSCPPTLEEIKKSWGKIIPIFLKSKANQPVSIWQNDSDYPGDYLKFAETYLLEAAEALVNCIGSLLERARLIAILIGKVAVASNMFIRRRKVLKSLIGFLKEISRIAERDDFDLPQIREILLDATQVVRTNGVDFI